MAIDIILYLMLGKGVSKCCLEKNMFLVRSNKIGSKTWCVTG